MYEDHTVLHYSFYAGRFYVYVYDTDTDTDTESLHRKNQELNITHTHTHTHNDVANNVIKEITCFVCIL